MLKLIDLIVMKRMLIAVIVCLTLLSELYAQHIGETWLLSKAEVTETSSDGTTTQEIPATDTKALASLIGPKELVFLSANKLSYKRMGSNDVETFSYVKNGKTLEIELSECLLTLSIEANESKMQLSEHKALSNNHTVTVTYSYTKQ